jgi:hypothetical protein
MKREVLSGAVAVGIQIKCCVCVCVCVRTYVHTYIHIYMGRTSCALIASARCFELSALFLAFNISTNAFNSIFSCVSESKADIRGLEGSWRRRESLSSRMYRTSLGLLHLREGERHLDILSE